MMVEEAEEYLSFDQRIKKLEERFDKYLYEERPQLTGQLYQLYRLSIELHQRVLHLEIKSRLQAIVAIRELSQKAELTANLLERRNEWFNGAFKETQDPLGVYNTWLKDVRESLIVGGFPKLFPKYGELPPLQAESED